MRMPKSGFNNKRFATKLSELTLGRLQEAIDAKKIDAKKTIDEDTLVKAGVVGKKQDGIKLLTKGELKAKVDLKITKASKSSHWTPKPSYCSAASKFSCYAATTSEPTYDAKISKSTQRTKRPSS